MISISEVAMTMTVHRHSGGNNVHITNHLCCHFAIDVVSATTGAAAVTIIPAVVIHLVSVVGLCSCCCLCCRPSAADVVVAAIVAVGEMPKLTAQTLQTHDHTTKSDLQHKRKLQTITTNSATTNTAPTTPETT